MFNKDLKKIKDLYNTIPDSYLKPLLYAPFDLFCGGEYRSTKRRIEKIERQEVDLQEELMLRRLFQYCNESILHTRFYSDFAKSKGISSVTCLEQFFEFPVIDKAQLEEDSSWFFDKRYLNNSYWVTTGGTSGRQTSLRMANATYGREWAFVNSYLESQGIRSNSRRISLRGTSGISSGESLGYNYLYKEILVSPFRLTEADILSYIDAITQFKPKWIHGYPSSVSEFSNILVKNGIELQGIDHVLLVSEKLYPEQKKVIEEAFNARVLTFYGMTERVIFAPEINGIMKPNKCYGATEEVNGELVGTGFVNEATRLVRYRTGDEAIVDKDKYGFVNEIKSVTGRWGKEFLVGRSNTKITMTALNIHSKIMDKVLKYQFFQTTKGKCELLLVPLDTLSAADCLEITSEFQKKTGDELRIEAKIVSCIPVTLRGKHRFIVSKLN